MLEIHEYAPGRTILAPDGQEFLVVDVITPGSGNDLLAVTQDRDLGPITLLQAGHTRDIFFPVEPEEPTGPQSDSAQAEAERLRNLAKTKEADAKAEKKARQKAKAKKDKGKGKKSKKSTKSTQDSPPSTQKSQDAPVPAPGPAAVSTKGK